VVLLVGSAQFGAQIAEELYQSGRKVYLSVSCARCVPCRYRGKETNWWHDRMGEYDRTVDQLPSPQAKFASKPMISGTKGGHTLNLHQFVRDGVTLLGCIQGVKDGRVILAQDLRENLPAPTNSKTISLRPLTNSSRKNGLDAREEVLPKFRDGYDAEQVSELDLEAANINIVIWATGYSFGFSMVRLPIFDGDSYPVQKRGITRYRICTL